MTKELWKEVAEEFYGIGIKNVYGDMAHGMKNMADEIVRLRDDQKERNAVIRQLVGALSYYSTRMHIGLPKAHVVDQQVYAGGSLEYRCTFEIPYEDGSNAKNALAAVAPQIKEWGLE